MAEQDWDQRLFNKLSDYVEKLIKTGYVSAWFTWLGWIAVTAVIFTVARSTNTLVMYVVGVISLLLIFFSGIWGLSLFFGDILKDWSIPYRIKMLIIIVVSFSFPTLIISILVPTLNILIN